jgi:uncharacterized hydrophobic protein (TIGR00271 family)
VGEVEPAQRAGRRESWAESWWRALTELSGVSQERRAVVLSDIEAGSQPTLVYYALLGISELIAGFALLIDSDATLIGANVVAPLMTPIFGIALGLARSDVRLLRTALVAELGGALVGVLLCFGLGLLPFALEITPSLFAQTQPTLIDLVVATLAGIAGALAMIDERVSPALPGVAIATALNPPIAAVGLCLALGAYEGAWGAFVLFTANVLAILAVAGGMFTIAGFVTREEIGSLRGLARRFSVAALGLVLITALLSYSLYGMVHDLRMRRAITATLDRELAHEPSTALISVQFDRSRGGGLQVLTSVGTPRVIEPDGVRRIQDALSAELGEPVTLYVRCTLTKDVTATGSASLRPYLSLNGRVVEAPIAPEMKLLQQAEQVAREVAASLPGVVLLDTELVQVPTGSAFVVSIETPRDPSPQRITEFEARVRERIGDPTLRVVVRRIESTDTTSKGRILFGAAHFARESEEDRARRGAVEAAVRAQLEAIPELFVLAIDAVSGGRGWVVRAEAVGARVPSPADVKQVEQKASTATGDAISVSLLARTELVVTSTRYEPLGAR